MDTNVMRKSLIVWYLFSLAMVATALRSDACATDEAAAMLESARAEERQEGLRLLLAARRVTESAFPLLHGIVTRSDEDDTHHAATERQMVEELLVSAGDEASPYLLHWTRDKSKWVRHVAARSFAKIGDRPIARDALRTALGDEDEEVRTVAAMAFATNVSPKNAVANLASLANDTNQPMIIRLLAAASLARAGDGNWVKFLLEHSGDDSPDVRAQAYPCLALAGQTNALIDILRNRGEKDFMAANRLCFALSITESEEASKALQELSDSLLAGEKTATNVQDRFLMENHLLRVKGLPPKHRWPPRVEKGQEDFPSYEEDFPSEENRDSSKGERKDSKEGTGNLQSRGTKTPCARCIPKLNPIRTGIIEKRAKRVSAHHLQNASRRWALA
jgi:HEAT repeat protein